MSFRRIKVESNLGAIGAFAEVNHRLFGLSAMHVLTGRDTSIDSTERIDVFNDVDMRWLPGGITFRGHFSRGSNNKPHDFGTIDAGLFSLAARFEDFVKPRIRFVNLNPFILQQRFDRLEGMRVFSYSGMYDKPISGVIDRVFGSSTQGNRYDLIIVSESNEVITAKGDSGLLWFDDHNAVVGMHISGTAVESTVSFSTFIHRIIDSFQIQRLFTLENVT